MGEYTTWIGTAIVGFAVVAALVLSLRGSLSSLTYGRFSLKTRQDVLIEFLLQLGNIAEIEKRLIAQQRRVVSQTAQNFRSYMARMYRELFTRAGYDPLRLKNSIVYRLLICHTNEVRTDIMQVVMNDVEQNNFASLDTNADVERYISRRTAAIYTLLFEEIENSFAVPANASVTSAEVLHHFDEHRSEIEAIFRTMYSRIISLAVQAKSERGTALERITRMLEENGQIKDESVEHIKEYLMGVI